MTAVSEGFQEESKQKRSCFIAKELTGVRTAGIISCIAYNYSNKKGEIMLEELKSGIERISKKIDELRGYL